MGVILRQGFKTTIVRMVATVIGMISMLFVYPLDHVAYGRYQFIMSCALLLMPFAGMGIQNIIIKYFTSFKNQRVQSTSIFPTFIAVFVGYFILFGFLYFGLIDYIFSWFTTLGFDESLLYQEKYWIVGLVFLTILVSMTKSYISNYGRVVIPSIIGEIGQKLFIPSIVLLVYFGYLTYDTITPMVLLFNFLVFLCLLLYILHLKKLTWKLDLNYFKDRQIRNSVLTFGLFSSLSSLGSNMSFRLDSFMITTLLDAGKNGLYFNILVIASVIDIPLQSIAKIASPVIAKSWEENNHKELQSIYQKSSIVNQIVGSIIFLGVWANLEHLFAISSKPEAFIGASSIFLILGVAKLFDGMMGLNSQIIGFSKLYKYNLVFLLILGILSTATNFYLIPKYGVIGAAIATFISLLLFNLLKFVFIKTKFGMQPFTFQSFLVFIIFVITAALVNIIPTIDNNWIAIIIKSIVVVGLFVPAVFLMKLSPDFNTALKIYLLDKVRRR
ncbi:MAG: polysaccharide biosynthesis C-terminal domain-containing protein [Saprospiraceae bacterium]